MLFPPNETTTAAAPELTEDQVHAELLKDSATPGAQGTSPAPADQPTADTTDEVQPEEGQGTPPAEETGDKNVAAPNEVLDELRAMRAELAELKAAKAADLGAPGTGPATPPANPTELASTRTLAQIDADEAQTSAEIRYLTAKVAKGESHFEPDQTEITPAEMQLMILDRQEKLFIKLPRARLAAQATTTQRTTVEAAVRQQYPTQFVPGTPAHAMNAAVAKDLAHLAHLPDAPSIIAEVTVGRLAARAIKPAAKAQPPNLPTGSATRPSVTGSKQPLDTNAQLEALQRKYPNGDIPEEELQRLM